MKRNVLLLLVASLVLGTATLLFAAEDHSGYRDMKIPECNECHRDASVAPSHLIGWNRDHAQKAAKAGSNCSTCHDRAYCMDCHYGGGITAGLHVGNDRGPNYMPRTHRSDFREIHPITALDNPRSCEKCHTQKFCTDCHAGFRPEELQFQSHRRGWSDLRTGAGLPKHETFATSQCRTCHPDSILPKHEWTREHAREARRDLASCQACHSDGDTCLKCHSARSGLMVNPHPDNWGSINKNINRAAGKRTCVKCH